MSDVVTTPVSSHSSRSAWSTAVGSFDSWTVTARLPLPRLSTTVFWSSLRPWYSQLHGAVRLTPWPRLIGLGGSFARESDAIAPTTRMPIMITTTATTVRQPLGWLVFVTTWTGAVWVGAVWATVIAGEITERFGFGSNELARQRQARVRFRLLRRRGRGPRLPPAR